MRKSLARAITFSGMAAAACAAQGQATTGWMAPDTKLVNVDTNAVPARNSLSLHGDVRVFGGSEKQAYGHVELNAGLEKGFGVVIRSTFSKFSTFNGAGFDIRHGGSDIEGMLKYSVPSMPNLMIAGGISLPNTPAQNQAFGTAEAVYGFPTANATFYLGARGAFRQDSSIVGISGGFDARLGQGMDLVGDVTGIVSGRNTYSTNDGGLQRRPVYGVALRFSPQTTSRQQLSFDVGITNGIGGTTGFSLTPSLGNSFGFMLGATLRY
jgi:hypothetical protein